MILYTAQHAEFQADVDANRIHSRIGAEFERRLRRSAPPSEVAAWRNSMKFMATALRRSTVPPDAGVSIEFVVPMTSKRVDFILTGRDATDRDVAVVVELKQWSEVEAIDGDAMVRTVLGGRHVETVHPSYQAWTYTALIEDYNEAVREADVLLQPCAYLHNLDRAEAILDHRYDEHIAKAPVFLARDTERLADFLGRFVRSGDRGDLLYRIEHGRIRPSKNLADSLVAMLDGKPEFLMIDDQKLVYETAIDLAHRAQDGRRRVLVVQGGPGTGKSVVAVRLLVELTRRGLVAQYVSRNAAPRAVYAAKLSGSLTRGRIQNLFRNSGSYHDLEPSTLDALLVDEAHRLTEKSGLYGNLGENQIAEILRASRFSVFFLDEDQRVTLADIGSRDEILEHAGRLGAEVHELALESQFRCSGSDGYLAFLDSCLQIRETASPTISPDEYDFRVFDDPCELRDAIVALDAGATSARLVAGYCWDWRSKKDPRAFDIEFPGSGFAARWNLARDGSLWMIAPGAVQEVGCIHTCQGLEVDYIGVIVGPDLVVRDGVVQTDPLARSRMDRSVRGIRGRLAKDPEGSARLASTLIRNTYRTLMSRGRKGCYVYCTDEETREWLRSLIVDADGDAPTLRAVPVPGLEGIPFRTSDRRESLAPGRAVEILDLALAAGAFAEGREVRGLGWVELPASLPASAAHFVARVRGNSMNKRIPDGAWCLFRREPAGTLHGRILVVAHRDLADSETGAAFTVKRYRRTRGGDGATAVRLEPETWADGHAPIDLGPRMSEELAVVAEFVGVLEGVGR